MKSYVITIMDNIKSVESAERCISSGEKVGGIEIKMYPAITPRSADVYNLLVMYLIPEQYFKEIYSREENCVAAFLSHYSLWKMCAEGTENFCIFEHDALITNNINSQLSFDKVINLGEPSYGKFNTPKHIGAGPLTSKRYFPGAHAYMISPAGAQLLIDRAMVDAGPTDIFLHLDRFPFLQEHYPWLAKADDNFTTIQNERGCYAKHNWKDTYEIL